MLLDGSIRVCVGNAYTLVTLGDDWLSCGKTPAACMSIEAGPDQTNESLSSDFGSAYLDTTGLAFDM